MLWHPRDLVDYWLTRRRLRRHGVAQKFDHLHLYADQPPELSAKAGLMLTESAARARKHARP